ncbi:hypothetical protein CKF54_00870 [Psittacicella hinzii]|uniref:Uncharacterized protein n=1 Tax=Psittacicella hinzii TaxID=2028575 RepID=A0A3A1Y9G6_9GAMM|nr:hypothetical protein [Psittacicella hinzii]RIY34325.1 hypothetical protein CKF54_00870 [Psittacicella hinzii]
MSLKDLEKLLKDLPEYKDYTVEFENGQKFEFKYISPKLGNYYIWSKKLNHIQNLLKDGHEKKAEVDLGQYESDIIDFYCKHLYVEDGKNDYVQLTEELAKALFYKGGSDNNFLLLMTVLEGKDFNTLLKPKN